MGSVILQGVWHTNRPSSSVPSRLCSSGCHQSYLRLGLGRLCEHSQRLSADRQRRGAESRRPSLDEQLTNVGQLLRSGRISGGRTPSWPIGTKAGGGAWSQVRMNYSRRCSWRHVDPDRLFLFGGNRLRSRGTRNGRKIARGSPGRDGDCWQGSTVFFRDRRDAFHVFIDTPWEEKFRMETTGKPSLVFGS